jgi:hypothetical protein
MSIYTDTEITDVDVHQGSLRSNQLPLTFVNFEVELNKPAHHGTKQFGEGGPAWQRF